MTVIGNSVVFKQNKNSKLQASVAITYVFKQNGEVVDFRKYNLLSPEILDSTEVKPNFIDIQRISLPNGAYNLEVQISDNNLEVPEVIDISDGKQVEAAKVGSFKMNDVFTIQFEQGKVALSDIAFVESYTGTVETNVLSKSGYDMVPYVSNYFPPNINDLIFYCEVYNLLDAIGGENKVLLKYYLESLETKEPIDKYNRFQRMQPKDVNVLFAKFDISDLPSGNYNLVVEIRNRENGLVIDKRYQFQRNNPDVQFSYDDLDAVDINSTFIGLVTDFEVMKDYLKCIQPITENRERIFIENLLDSENMTLMKQFFYNFWCERNTLYPEKEWNGYKLVVDMVNREFSTMTSKGYESDRGRIYLQYGAPTNIRERKHEPNAYPFQIWQYNELNGRMNQKFLFYNPSFVSENYELLHSNVLGEIQTKEWIYHLRKQSVSPTNLTDDLDNEIGIKVDDTWGSEALQMWENP